MIVQAFRGAPAQVEAEVLAIGVFDRDEASALGFADDALGKMLGRLAESKDLPKSVGEVMPLLGFDPEASGMAATSVVVFGLGKAAKFDAGAAFAAGVAVGKKLASKRRSKVAVVVPGPVGDPSAPLTTSGLVEGMIVGTVSPELRKAEPARHPLETLVVVGSSGTPESFEAEVNRGLIVGEAVNLARDLANLAARREAADGSYAAQVVKQIARSRGRLDGRRVGLADEAKIARGAVRRPHRGRRGVRRAAGVRRS